MDLTQGPVARSLIVFSIPIIAQMSIQPLFALIDRIFIAQLGPEKFNAVVNAAVLQMLVIMLSAGLANGVTSYVARLVGRGELGEADNAAQHSLLLMLILSGLFIAVFYPLHADFFRLLNMDEAYQGPAHDYIKVIILGNLTIMFSLIGANILRGEGDSKTPFWLALISVLVTLVLAPPLIFARDQEVFGLSIGWLGWGVFGGALAIVIGRGVGCLLLIGHLLRGKSVWTFSFKNFRWRPRHIIEILRVGFPMLLVNLSAWLASLVFLRVLNENPAAVVAFGMGAQLDMLAILPMIGLMLGVVAMVGQNYGSGNLDRAERASWIGALYAAVFCAGMGAVFMLFPDFWIGLFNKEPEPELAGLINRLGRNYIFIVSLTYALVAQVFVLGGAFQGLGKGLPPLIITAIRFLLVAIPLVLLLPRWFGPTGAWLAIAVSHAVGGVISIVWMKIEFRGRRQELSLPETQ